MGREAATGAGYEAAFTTYGARLGIASPPMGLGRYDVTTKDVHGVDSFTVGLSFKGMAAPGGDAAMAQEAGGSMVTEPLNGENITDPTPTIKANLETMGDLDAGTVAMRLSGLGQVPAKFDAGSKTITYTVSTPLKPGSYRAIISAKSNGRPVETAWSFTFYPDGKPPEAPSAPTATPEPKKKKK
jgi:hypothetical protein